MSTVSPLPAPATTSRRLPRPLSSQLTTGCVTTRGCSADAVERGASACTCVPSGMVPGEIAAAHVDAEGTVPPASASERQALNDLARRKTAPLRQSDTMISRVGTASPATRTAGANRYVRWRKGRLPGDRHCIRSRRFLLDRRGPTQRLLIALRPAALGIADRRAADPGRHREGAECPGIHPSAPADPESSCAGAGAGR